MVITKIVREWNVTALWGQIALKSWGKSDNPPILLLHGYMDTAATFEILLELLPDKYYYVALDMPGHGKSDPLPPGLAASQLHMVEAVRIIVEHLKWDKFVCMAHSMGCIVGLFYNYVFPDHIQKLIFLDPAVPLSAYYSIRHDQQPLYYRDIIKPYYDNYRLWSSRKPKIYTYDNAVSLVVRNRSVTEEQAEVILSRSLVPMGIDAYKLSFEPRMRSIIQAAMSEETLYTTMTSNVPTLVVDASEFQIETNRKEFAVNLLRKCNDTLPHFCRTTVEGGHDIHITNAKTVAPIVLKFIEGDVVPKGMFVKSKL